MWFFVFLLAAFRIFSLAFAFYYYMFLYRSLWIHLVRDSVLSALGYLIPSSDSQNFQPSFHQIHFDPFLSPHSGTLPVRMLECSMLSQKFLKLFFFFFCPTMWLWRYLVPQPGIKPRPTAVKVLSPNHWTTKEFLNCPNFFNFIFLIEWFVILFSRSLILSVSPHLLLILSSVFFISVIVFSTSDWFFFIFSSYNFHCVLSFFSQVQLAFLLLLL